MIQSRTIIERAKWCHWTTSRCVRQNPRAAVVAATCFVLFLWYYSPNYGLVYGQCHLTVTDESYTSPGNVTFGHLTIHFGREIRLQLFSDSDQPHSSTSRVAGGGSVKLSAVIGRTLLPHAPYRLASESDQLGLVFPGSGVRLRVSRPYDACYRITWESCSGLLRDSIQLSGAHWYGGPTVFSPRWPISQLQRPGLEPLVTGDVYKDFYGGVVERFWMSSKGIVVHVDYDVPLFVSMNRNGDGNLDIEARFAKYIPNKYFYNIRKAARNSTSVMFLAPYANCFKLLLPC